MLIGNDIDRTVYKARSHVVQLQFLGAALRMC